MSLNFQDDKEIARSCVQYLDGAGLLLELVLNRDEQIQWCISAIAGAKEISDSTGEILGLGNLGKIYAQIGSFLKAIEYFNECLIIAQRTNDEWAQADALGNLGTIYLELGEVEKSLDFLKKTHAISIKSKNIRAYCTASTTLGMIYMGIDAQKASAYYKEAIEAAQTLEEKYLESRILGNLSIFNKNLGKLDVAESHINRVLEICRELKDQLGEANALGILGNIQRDKKQINQAVQNQELSLQIIREGAVKKIV